MTKAFEIIAAPRTKAIEILKELSIDQLNTIPAGFNNNIIWNAGHMIAAQQGICYKRAGLDTIVGEEFFNTFKPGTKPERIFDTTEVENIISLFSTTLTQLEADLQTDMFSNYPAWVTRYGAELTSVAEAVAFLPFHEGLHIGTIVAMRKLVG
ncbi:DinB family protein [Mucilaginibacter sp. HMF5004]|uniref:DinB family protein n=1 Tax=Mucilaginibacter rivuli TaxID=2857527 RepID=UPI001C5DCA53|nr:DinB family protein [Mucilaginibacter rivuli]MBW4888387.1 DinB family protein [Mucilaginibacter rivuli]